MRIDLIGKISMVQCYIHHIKNVEVNISMPTNQRQLNLLDRAYIVAQNYFKR
jgi:hypothetical protein